MLQQGTGSDQGMNILWDFDGTLFDTYPAYTGVFLEVLDGLPYSEEEIMGHLKVSFANAIQQLGLSEEQRKEIKRRNALLKPEQLIPFPGVEKVLQVAGRNVIMTHKSKAAVLSILDYYGWGAYFQDMVAGGDGFPRKPDPASYRYLHERNKLDLIIGDRQIDIIPGPLLGIRTCLFQNDTPGADYYLSHYDDFFQVVPRL
jgi:HAD superfamily hydrolase (TIGR01549 family)